MKKLLATAVAATLSATAMADINIKGDAKFSYDHDKYDTAGSKNSTNTTDMEVNLNVVGKAGDTTVVADFELGDNGNDNGTGDSNLNVENLYMTTNLGPVKAKLGNYTTSTSALLGEIDNGGRSHGKMTFSYTTNGIVFYAGNNGSQSEHGSAATSTAHINNDMFIGAIATFEGWKLQLKKNGSSSGEGDNENSNIAYGAQGVVGPVGIRFEYKDDNRKDADVWFANFTGKFDNINLGLAMLTADKAGVVTENDSSVFQYEGNDTADAYTNSGAGADIMQLMASIAVDGTTYAAYIGRIDGDNGNADLDYYKVSAERTLENGLTAAVSYEDNDTSANDGHQNFSVDLSVKF